MLNYLKCAFTLCCIFVCLPLSAKLITITEKQYQSGGYLVVQAAPYSMVEFLDTSYTLDAKGYLSIGLSREVSGNKRISITSPSGEVERKTLRITPRKYKVQRVNGVPTSRVTPPAEVVKRIQAEAKKVRDVRAKIGDYDYWRTDVFQWPVQGRITGVYGSERFYNGKAGSPHWGIDIAAPKGESVYAPAGGKIVLAEEDLYYSGGTIILDHGAGVFSTFLHLSSVDVKVGQFVKKGEHIAAVGSTGRSTGPHLDWRMNIRDVRVDAALWIKE
ncbi:peptidase [Marinomonas ushuaiensis DSM 15871]|uniref:Peptidase n=1 Tax=Marinomonas ushuaiensis DSM 15871 TaxID=1122207 RepID=X7E7V0_9GAMM|nr:M23 family metallopeptidase [Marinomonas ushuaiensis]ETX11243.1 peptidase [Marinomonas ushuaiensis DSM 15871]